MLHELICASCGRRWTIDNATSPAVCPECGALFAAIGDDGPTVTWLPMTEEIAAYRPGEDGSGDADDLVFSGASGPMLEGDTAILSEEPAEPGQGLRTTVYDVSVGMPVAVIPAAESTSAEPSVAPPKTDMIADTTRFAVIAPPASGLAPGAPATATETHSPLSIMGRAIAAFAPPAPPAAPGAERPSPLLFKVVVSYASAVTLACAYLAYLLLNPPASIDLPDLAPPAQSENRVSTLQYLPPEKELPRAHRLRLGETRRYGSLTITPLRVTRGPLEFAFEDLTADENRSPSAPVLKLRLRFENSSADQRFVPLDRRLAFTKEPDRDHFGWFKANNFVCGVGERARHDRHVLAYDLAPDGPWGIPGANLDRELQPGEAVEAFIPTTEEGCDALSGPLVWRVHLRKGYNRQSFRGVTTLVEVTFDSNEIVDDGPLAAGGRT